jgi:hypothetical protein
MGRGLVREDAGADAATVAMDSTGIRTSGKARMRWSLPRRHRKRAVSFGPEGLAIALGVALVSFGGWLMARASLPRWVKGIWRPLGSNLIAPIIHMQGCGYVLIGISCWAASALHLLTPRSAAAWAAAAVTLLLLACGPVLYVRSLLLSRTKPA